jgi:hypothetical protein
MEGWLPEFLAGAVCGSLLLLGLSSLVRQQLAPSPYNRPSTSKRYRVADDPCRPIAAVVAAAEQEAITTPAGRSERPCGSAVDQPTMPAGHQPRRARPNRRR